MCENCEIRGSENGSVGMTKCLNTLSANPQKEMPEVNED